MGRALSTYPAPADVEAVKTQPQRRRAIWSYDRLLLLLFLLTLPFVNPWVRGDGVGYYAYIRALLIEHDLRFENDWRSANPIPRPACSSGCLLFGMWALSSSGERI
jgi:hypothetical protein